MSSFKQLNRSDVFTVPYVANKQWSLTYTLAPTSSGDIVYYQGKKTTGSFTTSEPTSSLGEYQRLLYSSVNHMFYQSYSGSLLNTSSLLTTVDNYQSASQQRPTASYFIYNDKLIKNLPSGSNQTIQIFSIDQNIYGEGILPYSFTLSSSAYTITEDGLGNLYSSSVQIGNIFYPQGMIVITNQNNQSLTYPISFSFKNQYTVYENYISCKINESEYNTSYNPSLLVSESETTYKEFSTGSDFNPYATTVGLYNSNNELLMVAKFAQPMLISSETDMTFLIRYDT